MAGVSIVVRDKYADRMIAGHTLSLNFASIVNDSAGKGKYPTLPL